MYYLRGEYWYKIYLLLEVQKYWREILQNILAETLIDIKQKRREINIKYIHDNIGINWDLKKEGGGSYKIHNNIWGIKKEGRVKYKIHYLNILHCFRYAEKYP